MKTTIQIAALIIGASVASARPDIESLGSIIQNNPFAKFGSSALEAFSGVSDTFTGLGIGTVFKRIAESSQVSEESAENTAYKFLRYATPMFSPDTIEQFLASPLNLVDNNTKLSSFFEQTQQLAKQQFDQIASERPRRLQKQIEQFGEMYKVFENVGKASFIEGKTPETAASSFVSQLSSFPPTIVGSFLSVPSMMQNVSPTSFFAQMRDSALQNIGGQLKRRLQLGQIADNLIDSTQFTQRISDNIPFASQLNVKDIPINPLKDIPINPLKDIPINPLKDIPVNPLKGIQQISSINPFEGAVPLGTFNNMISEMNPINKISTVSELDTPTIADLAPNSKFLSYFRDAARRVAPESAGQERRLRSNLFDFAKVQEKIAALTFENVANQALLSDTLNANDAANMWLSSVGRVIPTNSVRSFLENADVGSIVSADGPQGFYSKMMESAKEKFSAFF